MAEKLRLSSRPPANRGAMLLAWELAAEGLYLATVASLMATTGIDAIMLDRILRGEVVPAGSLSARIAYWSKGRVFEASWRQPAPGGWDTAPSVRHATQAMRRKGVLAALRKASGIGAVASRAAAMAGLSHA